MGDDFDVLLLQFQMGFPYESFANHVPLLQGKTCFLPPNQQA